MRRVVSIIIAFVIALIPLSSVYADDNHHRYHNQNGDELVAGMILGLGLGIIGSAIISSTNASQDQYDYYPRPENQWDDDDWSYRSHQSNRWQRPDMEWGPAPIECTRNISYDRHLGYVDQQTGRPCL